MESRKALSFNHFNDCYNINESKTEPVGGIARFKTALSNYTKNDPIVVFSGDIFSPSRFSSVFEGKHMLKPLKSFNVEVACVGNHDFDYDFEGLDVLVKESNIPWLMSNVYQDFGDSKKLLGQEYHIMERNGYRIGYFALAGSDWIAIFPFDATLLRSENYVTCAKRLTKFLREEKQCDFVIALTHMRQNEDQILAENFDGIDLILGGHDHERICKLINGTYIIKSDCDFREFTNLTLSPIDSVDALTEEEKKKLYKGRFLIDIEHVEITSKWTPDKELEDHVAEIEKIYHEKLKEVIGYTDCDIELRFLKIRVSEQNGTNFISDIFRAHSHSDVAFINSGGVRADKILPKGPITRRDIQEIFPLRDGLRKIEVSGKTILKALLNSVAQYPQTVGGFAGVSGITFKFDSKATPAERVKPEDVIIHGEKLDLEKRYSVSMKQFICSGKDGYSMFVGETELNKLEDADDVGDAMTNFFLLAHHPGFVEEWKEYQEHKKAGKEFKGRYAKYYSLVHAVELHEDGKYYIHIKPQVGVDETGVPRIDIMNI